jgi:hypothetical protein
MMNRQYSPLPIGVILSPNKAVELESPKQIALGSVPNRRDALLRDPTLVMALSHHQMFSLLGA